MPSKRDPSTPPPNIGKIGPYTVFMTPPTPPEPAAFPPPESPKKSVSLPPVQPPPQQFKKASCDDTPSDGSVLHLLRSAASRVHSVHTSIDDHLARWFGLNQSKYQWALDSYYESQDMEKVDAKANGLTDKAQAV